MEKKIYVKAQMRKIGVNVESSLLASSAAPLTFTNGQSASSSRGVESKENYLSDGPIWLN
jgi:hypothetical protein